MFRFRSWLRVACEKISQATAEVFSRSDRAREEEVSSDTPEYWTERYIEEITKNMNPSQVYIDWGLVAQEEIDVVGVATIRRWLEMGSNKAVSRKIDMLVVHCADTPDDRDVTAADIDRWHKEKGWSGIGYHYVIRRNGMIEKGRKDDIAGAHVAGHNSRSIGICLVGKDTYTYPQWLSLQALMRRLKFSYEVADKEIVGHYELDPHKTCPNIDGDEIRKLLGG